MAHAVFSPSRLHQILLCPSSSLLERHLISRGLITIKPSHTAQKGTDYHSKVEKILKSGTEPEDEYVKDCIQYRNLLISSIDLKQEFIEQRVSLQSYGLPQIWGTLDYAVFDIKQRILHIIDWKFGGMVVYAYDNPQLKAYAAGVLSKLKTSVKLCSLHIVQPKINNYDVYEISVKDLLIWIHTELAPVVLEGEDFHNLKLNPGEEQCKWCLCKEWCAPYKNWAQENTQKIFTIHGKVDKLTNEEISELLNLEPFITQTFRDLRSIAMARALKGNKIPGFKVVRGRSYRKWKNEKDVIKWLSQKGLEAEDIFETKLKSPAKLEKHPILKGEDLSELIIKPEGKLSLADENDRREEVEIKSAEQKFKEKLEQEADIDIFA